MRRVAGVAVLGLIGCARAQQHVAPQPVDAAPERRNAVEHVVNADCVDEIGMAFIPAQVPDEFELVEPSDPTLSPLHFTDAFWLDKYETTVEGYLRCVDAGECSVPRSSSGDASPTNPRDPGDGSSNCTWDSAGESNLPITCVTHLEHESYCAYFGKRSPLTDELQWAFSNRDKNSQYPWGFAPPTCELAIVDQQTGDADRGCGRGRPWPVGSRRADVTRDGVFDLAGSVAEMAELTDPPEAFYLHGRVGGSWATPINPESPDRGASPPWIPLVVVEDFEGNSSEAVGFRCAKDAGSRPPCTVAP